MLKIGEFSRVSQVPVKTLRYYEELGLISPAHVDAFTGYRYYTVEQLPRLNRILALKDLGFSLDQILSVVTEGVSLENLRGMLRLRQADQAAQVIEAQQRLARVEARLALIEREGQMSHYDIILKQVDPIRVAGVRGMIPSPSEQGPLWNDLYRDLNTQSSHFTGPCLTLYYEENEDQSEFDVEVCQPFSGLAPADPKVVVHEIPGGLMASTVHHGSYATMSQAFDALLPWIKESGYRVAGPGRDVYLQSSTGGNQNDPTCVTEIFFPVERA